jgi:small-conductance mechanosensitive channel
MFNLIMGNIGSLTTLPRGSGNSKRRRRTNKDIPVATQHGLAGKDLRFRLAKMTAFAASGYSGSVKSGRWGRIVRRLWLFALSACIPLVAAAPPDSIRSADVIAHLEQVISWYRELNSVEPSVGDVLVRDNLHQASLTALQLAFRFAHAESALIAAEQNKQNTAPSGNLQQAAAKAADRVATVQAKVAEIDSELQRAAGRQHDILAAQRNELNAELDLAKEVQTTVQNLVNFTGAIASGGGALAAQINELERSVPEATGKNSVPAANSSKAASATLFSADSAGLVGLATELFSIHSSRTRLDDGRKTTEALTASNGRLKVPLVNEARSEIQQSDQILGQASTQDQAQLLAAQSQLTTLANRFKQLSTAIVPLNEEGIAVGTAQSYLEESIGTLDQESARARRYLLARAGVLGILILVVLFISEMWRRATFRYVSDARRRRQYLVVRRVVVAVAISMALIFGFASEFGSLATYAGFVTAGVAVALQSPILSVVAYFFLIGRYGIRVGDRVTISGVTGEVIEIGFVRIYLMELAGTGSDLHSTGRVVVFSNSVIFQAVALYKQMPGIDYVWHTVMLTLNLDNDFQLAEETLNAAVESAYKKYGERIERQYASVEKSVDVQMLAPKPESRLRFTDAGLQYTVRYPAEIQLAVEMDNEILRALHDVIAKEPKLNFAPSGTPKLQAP